MIANIQAYVLDMDGVNRPTSDMFLYDKVSINERKHEP